MSASRPIPPTVLPGYVALAHTRPEYAGIGVLPALVAGVLG